MKEILKMIGYALAATVGIGFTIYAFMAFLSWITSDPFNWIDLSWQEAPPVVYKEDVDVVLCREKGGIAIMSGWTGRLKRCDPAPLTNN